jgi:hypothetical protein
MSDHFRAALVRIAEMRDRDGNAIEMHRDELRGIALAALHAKSEGQPAPDGAEATRPDDKEKRVTPGDEKGAEPAAWRALTKHWPCEGDEEWRYGPWVEGLDRSRFEPLYTHPPRGPDSAREAQDAARFQYLQNCPPIEAQAYFWSYGSRTERRKAIDAALAALTGGIANGR